MMRATHLRAEGITLDWLPRLRAALLAIGIAWSLVLGIRLIRHGTGNTLASALAGLLWLLPLAAVGASWWLVFFR